MNEGAGYESSLDDVPFVLAGARAQKVLRNRLIPCPVSWPGVFSTFKHRKVISQESARSGARAVSRV